jgi:hypothetical protein
LSLLISSGASIIVREIEDGPNNIQHIGLNEGYKYNLCICIHAYEKVGIFDFLIRGKEIRLSH